jgi:alpha-ketoglutarate-dependent taurine dioxygenase
MLGPDSQLSNLGYTSISSQVSSSVAAAALGHASKPVLLYPKESLDTDPWSLSGTYGLNEFPWHTDGAISIKAPDFIILRAVKIFEHTYTDLLDPPQLLADALKKTVLRVRNRKGQVRYLPASISKNENRRFRWDPRTCEPITGIGVDEVEMEPCSARIEWHDGLLLVIDNRRLLHRRPKITPGAGRILERTYVWENLCGSMKDLSRRRNFTSLAAASILPPTMTS